jgi:lysozyme family protein
MSRAELAIQRTLQAEGGYSNLSSDRGGRTYKGISEKNWPEWEGWKIIDKHEPLKQGEVIADPQMDELVNDFYIINFWNPLQLAKFNSQEICNEIFDSAVNNGHKTAVMFLQEGLNLLNRNERDYKDMPVDGIPGPVTISITNNFSNTQALLKTLNGLQFCRYKAICDKDPGQEVNFLGWLHRC